MIKRGIYCIHNSIEYSYDKTIGNKVLLTSYDRNDLNNGFVCNLNDNFIKKYGFYCQKEVPKSEITEAYEIRSHAVYKGVGATIIGCSKENWIGLRTCCLDGENIKDFLREVNEAGFEYITTEQGGTDVYGLDVSLDDPDLQIIEKRTELDISKL